MKKIYITEKQKKKLRKAIAAQDQVGGKVNSGIMLGVVGGMCESKNIQKWYRGFDSKFGIKSKYNPYLLWLTDDLEYAKEYGDSVMEFDIDFSKCNGSVYDLPEDIDYYDGPDKQTAKELLKQGINSYCFYANEDSSYCMCLWDKSPIVSSGIIKIDNSLFENIDDDTYELAPEKNEISPYYHIKENSEDTITLYHGVNLKNMEYNIEHGGFVPRVCSEGGPKSVWLSEKQYNYNFTFKFDIPKSLLGDKLQQLSNVDYVYDNFISFDDFNCTLIKTDISIHFQGMSVSLNILNDTVSKNQFEIFGKVDLEGYIEAIKEAFTNTPMVYEQYIEPFIEKYCSKLNENRENELKASEVDLSSFNIKKELNPKFWKDGHLDSRIRIKLLDIADDFIKFLGVDWVEPTDVIMTGSLANFNWDGKYSDVDLHIVMDFSDVDENTDLVEEYFQAKKTLWNDDHKDINVFGFPVELYVQEESEDHASSGVYSLYRDTWIVEPDRDTLSTSKVNKQFIKNKVAEYASLIDKLVYLYKKHKDDEYKIRKISEKAEKLWNKIKNSRKEGFEKYDGKEINNYNIIFKSLRRSGYLDKLYKLKTKTYDILSSL